MEEQTRPSVKGSVVCASLPAPGLPGSSALASRSGFEFVEAVLVGGRRSYEDFGEGVGSRAADVALGGMKRHVVNGLVELLPVSGELLDARLALHVPQTHGAVVT